jgi:hypothetical protein
MTAPYNEASSQFPQAQDPGYERYEFDRPDAADMWSYRVLRLEREVAWDYLDESDGSQEQEIQRLMLDMYHFGCEVGTVEGTATIEDAWTEETKYPDPAYEHMRSSPAGQCAVTNIVFGMLLGSTDLIERKNIYLARGKMRAPDGTILDKNHRWLHVVGKEGKEWRIDLTSHQAAEKNPDPNGFMRIVMQPVRHDMDPHPLINQPPLSRREYDKHLYPAKNATAIVYEEAGRTPIEEVDLRELNGRVEKLAERMGLTCLGPSIGYPDSKSSFSLREHQGLWYPKTYDFRMESSRDGLWGEADEEIRRTIHEQHPDLASRYNLNDRYTKETAKTVAEVGIRLAIRAHMAYTAMQRGETVVTDGFAITRPHNARETFEALQVASGNLIGRGTLGAYALEHLLEE